MSAHRLVPVLALLLASCAAWDSSSPANSAPPAETPTPSHYAPPPPGTPPGPVAAPAVNATVAIASVQLLQDCPDPAPAGAPAAMPAQVAPAGEAAPARTSAGARAKRPAGQDYDSDAAMRRMCTQSTVQLAVRGDVAGTFKIEGVRVLDASSKKMAGPAQLRLPTLWNETDGTYAPWDERTAAGKELKISYKLGDPDMSRATEQVGPEFNTYMGPFVLELDVSVAGVRQTIQSAEFSREPPHLVVT